MENSSKALLIAGAIILSILLVSLGMLVWRNASGATNGSTSLSKQEIQLFNSQWTKYGDYVTTNELKEMIRAINLNNKTETENGTNRWIWFFFRNGVYNPKFDLNRKPEDYSDETFKIGKNVTSWTGYYVRFSYSSQGYISAIFTNYEDKF